MKRIFIILAFLSCSVIADEVRVNMTGKSLDQFFIVASNVFGKTIVADPSIDGSVKVFQPENSSNFRDVWFSVIRAHGLYYVETKKVIRVYPKNKIRPEDKIITRTYSLNHIDGNELVEPLANALARYENRYGLSGLTDVFPVIGGRALMITAPSSMHADVKQIIESIDDPIPQILVRAVIIETVDTSLSELTVDFQLSAGAASVGFDGTGVALSPSDGFSFINTASDFKAVVKWLEGNSKVKIVSKPELLIQHGFEGKISVGQEVPILTGSYSTDGEGIDKPFQTIERLPVGLFLTVKPFVGRNDVITLSVEQQLSSVDKSVEASDIVTSERSIETKLQMRSGSTVALGGLVSTDNKQADHSTPILGDIPLLGVLFSSESESATTRDLTVLIYVERMPLI
ncbi:Type 3 secretion system secretin [Vibrio stylophorae]|uniref:Type 3 secretion system secretin n=1 Tax=Vibrio stylophorae TaxID=659351 RepID=A0ABM8ZXK9_9VIBR|nr:hypothetical protein [Vibrio stylophorae]CAH0535457.1 Type 3 secretion system secretin [Vibrio stylophorae]